MTAGVHVDSLARVADWVDVLSFQTSGRLSQPEPPTPHVSVLGRLARLRDVPHTCGCAQPTHSGSGAFGAGESATEKRWGQMGQPSGSSGYGRGHGEQGFNIKGSGADAVGGATHGVARQTPTEKAHALARARNMPVFNSRSGCADRSAQNHPHQPCRAPSTHHTHIRTRALTIGPLLPVGWNANPFDQYVEPARYNALPNYMWDHQARGGADCVQGCNEETGGCIAPGW